MSDHRRHEFLAIERPLDDAAIRALRALFPYAQIMPSGLIDSDANAAGASDPAALLDRWFDLYVGAGAAGGRTLALRLPFACLDPAAASRYCAEAGAMLRPTRGHLIVEFRCDGADPVPAGTAAALAGVRGELARGDLRPLYLGWLCSVQAGTLPGAAVEPPRPDGLAASSPAQAALAAFLALDADLVAAARRGAARPRTVAALRAAADRIGARRRRAGQAAA